MNRRGFSIVEVMISLCLASVAAIAGHTILKATGKAGKKSAAVIDSQATLQVARKNLETFLRNAGNDPGFKRSVFPLEIANPPATSDNEWATGILNGSVKQLITPRIQILSDENSDGCTDDAQEAWEIAISDGSDSSLPPRNWLYAKDMNGQEIRKIAPNIIFFKAKPLKKVDGVLIPIELPWRNESIPKGRNWIDTYAIEIELWAWKGDTNASPYSGPTPSSINFFLIDSNTGQWVLDSGHTPISPLYPTGLTTFTGKRGYLVSSNWRYSLPNNRYEHSITCP